MYELRSLDLCSGIYGLGLAAEAAGFQTVAVAEINPFCKKILQRVAPPRTPNLGDIRRANFLAYRGVDLITAGYPCQPFSRAGKRRGTKDDRHLWPAVFKALKVTRATWFVGENVAGHVTLGLDEVLSDLEGAGYAPRPFVIPACAAGAMQRRNRVVIVAYSHVARWKEQHAAEVPEVEGFDHRLSLAQWLQGCAEPPVVRRLHGIPHRVDRIKALGNSVYPAMFLPIFQAIAEIQKSLRS